jgi:hypothetical protein
MITTNEDGTVTIGFPATENGTGKSVELKAPRWGAYKRLRFEVQRLMNDRNVKAAEIDARTFPDTKEDGTAWEAADLLRRNQAAGMELDDWTEQRLVAWWSLVFDGDDSFASLKLNPDVPTPAVDDWLPEMIAGEGVIAQILNHWRQRPLRSTPTS